MVITTGIILAGGRGQRFGKEKYLILLNNQSLLERVMTSIESICNEILVVTSRELYHEISGKNLKAKIIVDALSGKAAMGGLYTGLTYSNTNYAIVVASDMPFLNSRLMQYMIDNIDGFDAVVPRINEFIEPLHAIYSKNCIENIKKLIDNDNLSLAKLLQTINTKYISNEEIELFDPCHLSFFNINTQLDLIRARKIIDN